MSTGTEIAHGTLDQAPTNLTRAEAAAHLRVSARSIDRRISDGTIKAAKIGARIVIPKSEIARLLAV
jgi:excisionase family DNA binding protein